VHPAAESGKSFALQRNLALQHGGSAGHGGHVSSAGRRGFGVAKRGAGQAAGQIEIE
jgi:hypothetical protein